MIPTYNHANYLTDAINSVLAQDYPHVELIVLDDGSTDETPDILAKFNRKFYWEKQVNMGQSKTLNRGWRIAKGEILSYLSADDLLSPNAVSTSVEALMSNPDKVATYCDFNLIDPHSNIVRKVILPEYNYEQMLTQVSCPLGPGAFFRRSAYLKSGPWNSLYKRMPDYDFWLRLGLYGEFIHLPHLLADFRVHEGSISYSIISLDKANEPILIISSILDKTTKKKFDPRLKKRALANANLVSAQLHLRSGRYKQTLVCVRQAFNHSRKAAMTIRTVRLLLNAMFNRTAHKVLWTVRVILKGKK